MTRMEYLIAENARLDAVHEQLLRGEIPLAPIIVDQVIEDGTGGFWIEAAAPAARKTYLGRPITTGPIARKLRSDPKSLFDHCPHCAK